MKIDAGGGRLLTFEPVCLLRAAKSFESTLAPQTEFAYKTPHA
ncbi:MAG: hypothetical protein ABIQ35_10515 [Verrucomicrobiota bacterium]